MSDQPLHSGLDHEVILPERSPLRAENAALRAEVATLRSALEQTHRDLDSERDRRVAAQEAITLKWEPEVATLREENARLKESAGAVALARLRSENEELKVKAWVAHDAEKEAESLLRARDEEIAWLKASVKAIPPHVFTETGDAHFLRAEAVYAALSGGAQEPTKEKEEKTFARGDGL